MKREDYIKYGGILLGAFLITRKKYCLPDFSFFIPNKELFSFPTEEEKKSNIIETIRKSVDIKLYNGKWLISFKPVYGIKIPIQLELPFFAFLSIPQIRYQIGNNIKIEPKVVYGVTLGYNISFKDVCFYA